MMSRLFRRAALAIAFAAPLFTALVAPASAVTPDSTQFNPLLDFALSQPHPCVARPESLVMVDSCANCLVILSFYGTSPHHWIARVRQWPAAACTEPCRPYAWKLPLPPMEAGPGAEFIEVHGILPADSLHPLPDSVVFRRLVGYTVTDSCPDVVPIEPGPLAFVQKVRVVPSIAACDSCPSIVCGDRPFHIAVSGLLPGNCWRYEGMSLARDPNGDPIEPPAIDVNFRLVSAICAAVIQPFADSITFLGASPGPHPFVVREWHRSTLDSTVKLWQKPFAYDAVTCDSLPPRPQPEIQHIAFGPGGCDTCSAPVCPGEPMRVRVFGTLPDACWQFEGLELLPVMSPIDRPIVVAKFRDPCPSFAACVAQPVPFVGVIDVAPGYPGTHSFEVRRRVRTCTDSTQVAWLEPVSAWYVVRDTCPFTPVCAWPLLGAAADGAGCVAHAAPGGGRVPVRLTAFSGTALAGLQGEVRLDGPLVLDTLVASGDAKAMHLLTRRTPAGMTYVLWADRGAPVHAGSPAEVLQAIVHAPPGTADGADAFLDASVTAASDSGGHSLPLCSLADVRIAPLRVCIDTPPSCDANADGRVNVADLVRMARCWLHPETCPDSVAAHPDCTGDGAFHVDDILCCARGILGGRDSAGHAAPNLRLSLGAMDDAGGAFRLGLSVRGAGDMSGALLHLRFQSADYSAAALTDAVPAGWLPVVEAGTDELVIGLLRVDDAAPANFTLPLAFTPRSGQPAGGWVAIDRASVTAPDGSALAVDVSGLQAGLPAAGGPVSRIELLCGPNPASEQARFVVRLPAGGTVDLGLYDISGRRVTTLWHGAMAAGETTVPWNAASARAGVYFARLTVNGTVRTTRITVALPH